MTRVIVKDPFAMLSLPAIAATVDAKIVLLYRHPAAMLSSYRKQHWQPDLDEVRELLNLDVPPQDSLPQATAMGLFWAALYRVALTGLPEGTIVVSHQGLAAGGSEARERLIGDLGLDSSVVTQDTIAATNERPITRLHNLNRNPEDVASAWKSQVSASEIAEAEGAAGEMWLRIQERSSYAVK